MIRRPPRSTQSRSSAASDVYKRQTWYPQKADDGPLFVGNLDYLFDQAQGQYPYDVWVKVKNGADPTVVAGQVRSLGRQQWGADDVHTVIETEMARPERQGLFGVLTIGFLAAAFFTALGSVSYTHLTLPTIYSV